MASIYDTAMDLEITASWIGEEPYGSKEQTKKHLHQSAQKLRAAYLLLMQITGANPCEQNKKLKFKD
jgi:hypothetical protein